MKRNTPRDMLEQERAMRKIYTEISPVSDRRHGNTTSHWVIGRFCTKHVRCYESTIRLYTHTHTHTNALSVSCLFCTHARRSSISVKLLSGKYL